MGCSYKELMDLFLTISIKAQDGISFNGNIFEEIVNDFIKSHRLCEQVDRILFFHLGHRLNQSDFSVEGRNLFELLTTDNEFSSFLKKYEITFTSSSGVGLDLIYNGKLKSLDRSSTPEVCYLRNRLGYNVGREDYCFNGFAFRDLIFKNHYARDLFYGPEFLSVLSRFLQCNKVVEDYNAQSQYYCFDYCVPFDSILFDDDDKMSKIEKESYFIKQIIKRLYDYSQHDARYVFDHDNPILRLSDTATMKEEFFIRKEEIHSTMLVY